MDGGMRSVRRGMSEWMEVSEWMGDEWLSR